MQAKSTTQQKSLPCRKFGIKLLTILMNHEIQHIISGEGEIRFGTTIQATARYLARSQATSSVVKEHEQSKLEETKKLIGYIKDNNLWVDSINAENYVSEGAEQKVYIKGNKSVLKLNDAIYYLSWIDYLHNLLLHNYFFPDTAYQLLGFYFSENTLYAVVEQAFVKANENTDLDFVKQFMQSNGFHNTKNNDYYNPSLGIILEDLHDENVLTRDGILYFIDTVFYIQDIDSSQI